MILVTGSSGLVGSALLKQLVLRKERPIVALYRTTKPALLSKEEQDQIQWIQGDILDTSLLYDLMNGCKQVYHCAAIVSFHPSRRKLMDSINIQGTANVVNAALENKVTKLVHVSSVAAIGRSRTGEPANEKNKWQEVSGISHYALTKHFSELEVWRGIGEGLKAVIINPSIILGEDTWEDGSAALFKKAYHEFPWYTEGTTGFVDVKDVARIMIEFMHHDLHSERFIVSNEHLSYRELLTKIAVAFGKKPPRFKAPNWMIGLLWRLERIKSIISNEEPVITKETAQTAKSIRRFDSSHLQSALPDFRFTPIDETIRRTTEFLTNYYDLNE
jgi:nucleoside-diphosphate-sugar epimerase